MKTEHPITPPPELVEQWIAEWSLGVSWAQVCRNVALVAARWGADQELEACCELLNDWELDETDLRFASRPKPPSLKEQALKALKNIDDACGSEGFSRSDDTDIIRRALEQLND